jgi:invasion protein IalB
MMRVRFSRNFRLSIIAAMLLPISVVEFAYGQQKEKADSGGEKANMEFASRGQRDAGSKQVCRTTISGEWETGQQAVRIDLIEREGEGASRLQLFLPVGLYLQAGAKLSVDQGNPYEIPYVWCLTNICIAGDKANANLVTEMESGGKLKLEVVDTNLLTVSTLLPLAQFASTRKSAPSQIYQQDVNE